MGVVDGGGVVPDEGAGGTGRRAGADAMRLTDWLTTWLHDHGVCACGGWLNTLRRYWNFKRPHPGSKGGEHLCWYGINGQKAIGRWK